MIQREGTFKYQFILACLIAFTLLTGCKELNQAPVANAGNEAKVNLGDTVYLNGNQSYDPDGDNLEYQWVLTIVPDGSTTTLQSANLPVSMFVADMPGVYIAELIVFDGTMYSSRDYVLIKVNNMSAGSGTNAPVPMPPDFIPPPPVPPMPPMPPVDIFPPMPPGPPPIDLEPPSPGSIYFTAIGEPLTIKSDITDNTGLRIIWNITQKPEGAQAKLTNAGVNEILFSSDTIGSYQLTEAIAIGDKMTQNRLIQIQVVESIITAGLDRKVLVNSKVALHWGIYANIPPMEFISDWEFTDKPENSVAEIARNSDGIAEFIPDVPGEYTVLFTMQLPNDVVHHDSVVITAIDTSGLDSAHDLTLEIPCTICHNGVEATGKSGNHIFSTDACESCHAIFSWIPINSIDHTQVIGACVSCHNGNVASGKFISHIPSTDICDACHVTTSFIPAIVVDHTQVIGTCADCHALPVEHMETTKVCEACHSTVSYSPVLTVDHSQVISSCDGCHVKPTGHIETQDNCDACHNDQSWLMDAPVTPPVELDISLSVDPSIFTSGELVKASATLTNTGKSTIVMQQASSGSSPLVIQVVGNNISPLPLRNPNDPAFDLPVMNFAVLLPGETIYREVIWDQTIPGSGLVASGSYTIEAYVNALTADGTQRTRVASKTAITIERPLPAISEAQAIKTALNTPEVLPWYELNGNSIMCRVENQIALVTDFEVTPIVTLVAIPESDIRCNSALNATPALQWEISFFSKNETDPFDYQVIIDATSGEVLQSAKM